MSFYIFPGTEFPCAPEPTADGLQSISAENWIRTYNQPEQYYQRCESEEQVLNLALAMAEDAEQSRYQVGALRIYDLLLTSRLDGRINTNGNGYLPSLPIEAHSESVSLSTGPDSPSLLVP